VSTLANQGVAVYQVMSHPPTLEDVYFELEARIVAETGDASLTDGFERPLPAPAGPAAVDADPEAELRLVAAPGVRP